MSPIGRATVPAPCKTTNGIPRPPSTNGRPRNPDMGQLRHSREVDPKIMAILQSASSDLPQSAPFPRTAGPPPTKKRAVGRPPNPDVSLRKASLHKLVKRKKIRTGSVGTNGMPPPSLPSKVNFRARALDPQRQMPVHIVKVDNSNGFSSTANLEMLYNNKPMKTPLFSVPSGMEREEERELHLRRAIEAQKASTLCQESHIPTRQVEVLTQHEYQRMTNWERDVQRGPEYLPLERGDFEFCDDDTSYDADEHDNEWLERNNNFISIDEFELMIEKLEVMAGDRIPYLDEVTQKHPELDCEVIVKVYDYWVERKTELVRTLRMNACLVPLVPSKTKPGEKENPYIAFRHRGPRVTTRRKQRLETEHYGTILKLAAMVRRTHLLTKGFVERERLKVRQAEEAEKCFECEIELLQQSGYIEDEEKPSTSLEMPPMTSWLNKHWCDVVNDVLDYNKTEISSGCGTIKRAYVPGAEDGRFAFQKHPSCYYRMPGPQATEAGSDGAGLLTTSAKPKISAIDSTENMSLVRAPDWEQLTGLASPVFGRARFGRSGRLNLDFVLPNLGGSSFLQ
ncbi:unnamed protein product [Bursaphelenchus xylophilus]|uniref:Enhancer of polycomb-like protein n=1 Tax=Bursaphelenchus xylophilus TaxID=6326 RepID=A0A1I7SQR9_BURXY|nr:unnamed protein product [Bursaphelenchus xylophilus]CAG9110297.1 unnamed protein product [Bursaphelenchus xylophilus]